MTRTIAAAHAARADGRGPRQSPGRIFPGAAEHVAAVRRFVRSEFADHRSCDDAVTVASELASNAIAHSRSGDGGVFMVDIAELDAEHVAILVTDQGTPAVPQAGKADLDGESGRGLMVVIGLASAIVVLGDRSMRTVAVVIPASSELKDRGSEMTGSTKGALRPRHTSLEGPEIQELALAAARQFLADTVEAITPETSARELLECAARSRAHLAALIAASSQSDIAAAGNRLPGRPLLISRPADAGYDTDAASE